jgi:hypothetical protein
MKTRKLYSIAIFTMLIISSPSLFSQNSVVKDVVAQLSGKCSGEISKSELSKNATIICVPSDYIVKSFVFSIAQKGDIYELNCTGNILNEQVLSFIKASEVGEKFIIENIIAEKPGTPETKLAPMVFTLK